MEWRQRYLIQGVHPFISRLVEREVRGWVSSMTKTGVFPSSTETFTSSKTAKAFRAQLAGAGAEKVIVFVMCLADRLGRTERRRLRTLFLEKQPFCGHLQQYTLYQYCTVQSVCGLCASCVGVLGQERKNDRRACTVFMDHHPLVGEVKLKM